jgi:RhtB (resistance to homoserine/threonine) family protein
VPVDPHLLLAFAGVVVLICVVPGPDMAFIVANGMRHGQRGGVAAAFGMAGGMVVHTTAAALGLSALIRSSAAAFEVVRLVGALYLLWMGIEALRARPTNAPAATAAAAAAGRVFRRAVLTNVLNPKVIVFYLAFLPQFVDPHRGAVTAQLLVLGAVFALIGLVGDLLVALLVGRLRTRVLGSARVQRVLDRISGVVFVGLAARLASERP